MARAQDIIKDIMSIYKNSMDNAKSKNKAITSKPERRVRENAPPVVDVPGHTISKGKSPKLTLTELIKSTRKHRKKFNISNKTYTTSFLLDTENNALVVSGRAKPKTDPHPKKGVYKATVPYVFKIVIYDVQWADKKGNGFTKLVNAGSIDKPILKYLKPINASKNKVAVNCSCKDYYYTFYFYNKTKAGAHTGADMPRYRRKTTTRPPRNLKRVPGLCKHLFHMVNAMKVKGFIRLGV